MALIHTEQFERVEKSRNSVHKPTLATYTIFTDGDKKYFQIDTFGTIERLMPEKVSQSIQIDESMARMLIEVLRKEFSLY